MDQTPLHIDADITKAATLPAGFYTEQQQFERSKEALFAGSWQWAGDDHLLQLPGQVWPFHLMPGFLHEPLILLRDQSDRLHCLPNVCTHRGNKLVENPCQLKKLRCAYHGRRFTLNGKFDFMPEFEAALNFPTQADDLVQVPHQSWHQFQFVSLAPKFQLDEALAHMEARVGWMNLDQLRFDSKHSREYLVQAHWALYCDNYLEGFHIPYVHAGLNDAIDYNTYETVLFDKGSLQIGYASGGTEAFHLPQGHPDHGKQVAAYYYWLFPNMMFNFYPWGLSVNLVMPQTPTRTKVIFLTYWLDESKYDQSAGASLDKVEREDEWIVENVQQGIQSRFYHSGRFSPSREQGVHHFHQMIARFMADQ